MEIEEVITLAREETEMRAKNRREKNQCQEERRRKSGCHAEASDNRMKDKKRQERREEISVGQNKLA